MIESLDEGNPAPSRMVSLGRRRCTVAKECRKRYTGRSRGHSERKREKREKGGIEDSARARHE